MILACPLSGWAEMGRLHLRGVFWRSTWIGTGWVKRSIWSMRIWKSWKKQQESFHPPTSPSPEPPFLCGEQVIATKGKLLGNKLGTSLKKKKKKQVLKALWQCLEPSSMCYPGFSAQWWHLEVWLPDWVTSEGWGNHMLLVSLPYLAASLPDCRKFTGSGLAAVPRNKLLAREPWGGWLLSENTSTRCSLGVGREPCV